jgi:thioester reductase-like protein
MLNKNKKTTVFLTGATGLVGSYLLKILLENGHKVYALSRNKDRKSAKQRVVDILNFWDKRVYPKCSRNLKVIVGDIAESGLGLSQKHRKLLKSQVEEIFHSAAVTDIGWPLAKIRAINVGGTKRVLDLALECKKIKKVNHISTAYVCGNHKGVFKETDLDVGQKFNTTYEQSKFEAEKLVGTYRRRIPIDIYRPSVVIGESKTGKINEFRNIYQFLHLCRLEIFKELPISGGQISIVFVDDASRAIYMLAQKNHGRNKTYNIFPAQSVALEGFLKKTAKQLAFKAPKMISAQEFNLKILTPVQKQILKRNILVINIWVKLNSKVTQQRLKATKFQYHDFNALNLKRIFSFFQASKKRS